MSPILDALRNKELLGALSVVIASLGYSIYAWQTIAGKVRPHPLSWFIFGLVTGTGFWIQWDQAVGAGSWVMGVTSAICFLLCVLSVWKGERKFPLREWVFLGLAGSVFLGYLWSRKSDGAAISAILATTVDVLAYGPTVRKAWSRPYSDSAWSFALNSGKFIPSLFVMDAFSSFSIATCIYPATLVVANAGVVVLLVWRRRYLSTWIDFPTRNSGVVGEHAKAIT